MHSPEQTRPSLWSLVMAKISTTAYLHPSDVATLLSHGGGFFFLNEHLIKLQAVAIAPILAGSCLNELAVICWRGKAITSSMDEGGEKNSNVIFLL